MYLHVFILGILFLLRIATNTDQFLQKLDIKGPQRHKLQLRATDVVLFGPLPSKYLY